ncbi:MAG: TldD/PmbA family protein [Alphaproteobacteria bacterium]|nr:TldD/PmbA family protein [Alphaproteobacteria bacterium]MBV9370657.1 TldD/PmbA family protein [Alphaproteobacteria bacterium]MBV9899979.1 TldD/PmbA family protein [Alphaproteobacteria bacterium]
MLPVPEAEARVAALVERAKRAGADAADAVYFGDSSTGMKVRLGKLEDVSRSEAEEVNLRVFVGRRSASVSSSDLSGDAVAELVERVVAMAREAPEDPWAGLAPEERLARGALPDVDGDDGGDPSPVELKARALAAEEAARAVPGVTNSEGAGISAARTIMALATSHGFCRGYSTSGYSASASVIAGAGGGMQRDYDSHSVRHYARLDPPEAIGRRAGERAVARLDPSKIESGGMPILFDPRVGSSLLGHFVTAITGGAIARRTSFLLGKEGRQVFAPGIVIRDDPHRPQGLRSKPFDAEGVATAPSDLVADGRLTGWLLDSASARQLGLQPTGHATRGGSGAPGASATNVHLEPGPLSRAALIAGVERGIYVTELIGQGVNPVTGDYSRGASGFIIEGGEIGPSVAEITVAGNLLDMFLNLTPAGDLEFRHSANVPTLRIDGMTVAGA